MILRVTEPKKKIGQKGPLEVIWSNLALKAGPAAKSDRVSWPCLVNGWKFPRTDTIEPLRANHFNTQPLLLWIFSSLDLLKIPRAATCDYHCATLTTPSSTFSLVPMQVVKVESHPPLFFSSLALYIKHSCAPIALTALYSIFSNMSVFPLYRKGQMWTHNGKVTSLTCHYLFAHTVQYAGILFSTSHTFHCLTNILDWFSSDTCEVVKFSYTGLQNRQKALLQTSLQERKNMLICHICSASVEEMFMKQKGSNWALTVEVVCVQTSSWEKDQEAFWTLCLPERARHFSNMQIDQRKSYLTKKLC